MLVFDSLLLFGILNFVHLSIAESGYNWENVFNEKVTSHLRLQRYQGKRYYMGTHFEATYHEALQFCNEIHMKLLSIRSEEENKRILKFIREESKGDEYWTSGTRLVDGRSWLWLPYAEPIDYTNWTEGEPNDIDEKCLQLWIQDDRLEWNDNTCDTRFYFICERYDNQTDFRSSFSKDKLFNSIPILILTILLSWLTISGLLDSTTEIKRQDKELIAKER